jgi:hypothetical protein
MSLKSGSQRKEKTMNNIVCGHGQLKRQCPLCEKDEQIAALESILRRIINDLPTNRDWLDPELEKAARDILKGECDGTEI